MATEFLNRIFSPKTSDVDTSVDGNKPGFLNRLNRADASVQHVGDFFHQAEDVLPWLKIASILFAGFCLLGIIVMINYLFGGGFKVKVNNNKVNNDLDY